MEKERSAYLKSVEDMLFMVSHEIRRPITSCQGILNLLTEDNISLSKEEYDDAISYMMHSAKELDGYSRKLNDYLQNNVRTERDDA
jgi:signal transduction histidine kinase